MEMWIRYGEKKVGKINKKEYFCDLNLPEKKLSEPLQHSFLYLSGNYQEKFIDVFLKYHSNPKKNTIRYEIKDEKEYNLIRKILEGTDHCHNIAYIAPDSPRGRLKFNGKIKYSSDTKLQTFFPSYYEKN